MSEKINQLCKIIAAHPSKINLVNEAIKIALSQHDYECFKPIIDLIKSFGNTAEVINFRDNKLQIIFTYLLDKSIKHPQSELFSLIQQAFSISSQKDKLTRQFIQLIVQKQIVCPDWPASLLISALQKLSLINQNQQESPLAFISKLIIGLPHFNELNIPQNLQNDFKKNFQKLLISTLANPHIQKDLVHQIYHNIGEKVFSKLQNPLILSNHCLNKFANDPQLQIQVLSCIFLLVGKYGLQLQQFYPKLQGLVKKRINGYSIYQLPNSRRFFKLLQAALRSSRVPFKTVSAFAHILIKQIAGQQSQFSFWSLSFIVNLTKKHRKLLDELPLIPELKVLKYHYNPKIRALVQELSKNLNKVDYLEIQDFGNINFNSICQSKMDSLISSLQNEDLQFKIPAMEDYI